MKNLLVYPSLLLASLIQLVPSTAKAYEGPEINAATYIGESHPQNSNIIRKIGDKVGYIQADPKTGNSYFSYNAQNFEYGATHFTVKAASGAKNGGTLYVRLANHYSNTIATVNIPYTGGWDKFQEFTVKVDQEVLYDYDGGLLNSSLYFVVESDDAAGFQFDVKSFRFSVYSGQVGEVINATTYVGESHAADDNIIRNMGSKVGYIKADPKSEESYFIFEGLKWGKGATHFTVKAANGGSVMGTLYVRLANHYSNTIAEVNIPPTGGWNTFKEFTVEVDQEVLYDFDGGLLGSPIFFVVESSDSAGYQFDVKSFRFDDLN